MIEVETRGLLDKGHYFSLISRFKSVGQLVENDKLSQFFSTDCGILKVSRNISKGTATLSCKIGNEKQGNLIEREVNISDVDYDKCCQILEGIGFKKREIVEQERYDIKIDDLTLSLKYTEDWGYHFEIDIIVQDQSETTHARKRINRLCASLNITPLSPAQLEDHLTKIKNKH